MPNYTAQRTGRCPYCMADAFDATQTETRRPGQDLMLCTPCTKWSVRMRGVQYPLQDPTDSGSSPSTTSRS